MLINKHGVEVVMSNTGHFGRTDENGYWRDHLPLEVPVICTSCKFFEREEWSDGDTLAPPCCARNVFFPTRKGSCKVYKHV